MFITISFVTGLLAAFAYGSLFLYPPLSVRYERSAKWVWQISILLSPIGCLPLMLLMGTSGLLSYSATVPFVGLYLYEGYSVWIMHLGSLLTILWSLASLFLWLYLGWGLMRHLGMGR